MKFISRKDTWLTAIIWTCVLMVIGSGLLPFFLEGEIGMAGSIANVFFSAAVSVFLLWIWYVTYYELRPTALFIRCGPITRTVPYDSITSAKPIRSLLSSMATSIHRIEVRYGPWQSVHVSPLDQEEFLAELKRRCPRASIEA
jgi:hypothetical protein